MKKAGKPIPVAYLMSGLLLVTLLFSACVSTTPYINKNVSNQVNLEKSQAHSYNYVMVNEKKDHLVVYGKVFHHHDICRDEGHVDLAIVSSSGDVTFARSMVLKHGSTKVTGWHGAAFRGRFNATINPGDAVTLKFHGEDCFMSETFNCEDNAAVPKQSDAPASDA